LESLGVEATTERELLLIEAESADQFLHQSLPTPHFVSLVAWDIEGESEDVLESIARSLLANGCAYVCCWGRGCERLHDAADRVDMEPGVGAPEGYVVMTTWHDQEPLSEAIWFSLTSTSPDEYAESTLHAVLGVAIGNAKYAEEIRAAFKAPRNFIREVLEGGEGAA